MAARVVSIGSVEIGEGRPLALIAGPCVIESAELALGVAERVRDIADGSGAAFRLQVVLSQGQQVVRGRVRRTGARGGAARSRAREE